jgi:hypothetical protein
MATNCGTCATATTATTCPSCGAPVSLLAADPFAADPSASPRPDSPPVPAARPAPSTITGRGPVTGRPVGSEILPKKGKGPIKEIAGGIALLVFLAVIAIGLFPRIFGDFSKLPAINDFSAGTCYIIDGPGIFSQTACSNPHDGEVVGGADREGAEDYPGTDVLEDWANTTCVGQFVDFVGIEPDSSDLNLGVLYPSESSWQEGDRRAVCAVQFPDAPETGSVGQSRR